MKFFVLSSLQLTSEYKVATPNWKDGDDVVFLFNSRPWYTCEVSKGISTNKIYYEWRLNLINKIFRFLRLEKYNESVFLCLKSVWQELGLFSIELANQK
jgi:hypothetical protein